MQEFFDAIKAGELERVKQMVSATPALVNARGDAGSAVLTAVYHRHKEIVNLLVARGAELSLFEACAAGELERVERFISHPPGTVDVDINAHSSDGWTPLHLASFFGHAKVIELLLAHGADVAARSTNSTGNTPLHAALAANQKMAVGLLIGHGADVNAPDASGWRPLHLAAVNNALDVMKTLIAQGADAGGTNREGLTAMQLAEQKGHREAAALLKRHL
jgi:ankyrin repeat protein